MPTPPHSIISIIYNHPFSWLNGVSAKMENFVFLALLKKILCSLDNSVSNKLKNKMTDFLKKCEDNCTEFIIIKSVGHNMPYKHFMAHYWCLKS